MKEQIRRWGSSTSLVVVTAILATGCAGTVVGTMSAREQRVTCIDGGHQRDGSPYPARIRVPACVAAAKDAASEADRQRFRAQACTVSYAELSRPPDGMTADECRRAKNVAGGATLTKACAAKLDVKLDGNVVAATLQCDEHPVAGATIGLSSPLTRPHDDPSGLKHTQLSATTNQNGLALFDLSGVEADATFYPTLTTAEVYFNGEFESGKKWREYSDYTLPLTRAPSVDLKRCPLYPTWQSQASAARNAERSGADAELAKFDGECSQGNGESCIKLAWSYSLSAASSQGTARQQATTKSDEYYRKACDLKVDAACTRIEADREARAGGNKRNLPAITRQITSSDPLQVPVTVSPGQSVTASFTTTQDNARLSCDFRALGQTNQAMFDHSNGGQGKPCTVGLTNKGALGVTVVLVVATNYGGHPITVNGDIESK